MRSRVRAYSHQGHGPRADREAGYISATSDSTSSLANGSPSIDTVQLRDLCRADGKGRDAPEDETARAVIGAKGCGFGSSGKQASCLEIEGPRTSPKTGAPND